MLKSEKGFSLVEVIVAVTLIAVLTIIAVPSLRNYIQRNRLVGTGQQLYYMMQLARSEAVKRNTNVFVSLVPGSNWCYGINTGATCNCSVANSCNLGRTTAPNSVNLTLSTSGLTSNSVRFEPNHGAASSSGSATFTTSDGSTAISVKIGLLGSLTLCSGQLTGYQACS